MYVSPQACGLYFSPSGDWISWQINFQIHFRHADIFHSTVISSCWSWYLYWWRAINLMSQTGAWILIMHRDPCAKMEKVFRYFIPVQVLYRKVQYFMTLESISFYIFCFDFFILTKLSKMHTKRLDRVVSSGDDFLAKNSCLLLLLLLLLETTVMSAVRVI